jgi:DNA-binding transcriptional LysR family regulator
LAALDGPALPPEVRFIPFGRPEPLVAVLSPTALPNKIRAMTEAAGVERRIMCELGTITEMVRMAATGAAVVIVPRAFTQDSKGQPGPPDGIRALPLAEPDGYLTLGLFCHRDRGRHPPPCAPSLTCSAPTATWRDTGPE